MKYYLWWKFILNCSVLIREIKISSFTKLRNCGRRPKLRFLIFELFWNMLHLSGEEWTVKILQYARTNTTQYNLTQYHWLYRVITRLDWLFYKLHLFFVVFDTVNKTYVWNIQATASNSAFVGKRYSSFTFLSLAYLSQILNNWPSFHSSPKRVFMTQNFETDPRISLSKDVHTVILNFENQIQSCSTPGLKSPQSNTSVRNTGKC